MKKYIILVLTLLIYTNIFSQEWSDKILKIESFNQTKSQIYNKALVATYDIFLSGKQSIDLVDKEIGVLMGRGSFETNDVKNGFGQVLGSRYIYFKYKIEIKDNKIRITISDHEHEDKERIGRLDGEKYFMMKDKQWNQYRTECSENANKIIQTLIAAINNLDDF